MGLGGSLLPGNNPDDLIAELRQIIEQEVELEVLRYDLFFIASVIRQR